MVKAALTAVDAAEALRQMGRAPRVLPSELRPSEAGISAVGRVRTAFCLAGDNRSAHAVLDESEEGEVLVLVSGGAQIAVWGGLMATEARRRGLQGVIVEGYIRDIESVRASKIPTWSRGTALLSGSTTGPTCIDVPVTIGDVRVSPGDHVVGDEDGIVLVEGDLWNGVNELARRRARDDGVALAEICEGKRVWELIQHD